MCYGVTLAAPRPSCIQPEKLAGLKDWHGLCLFSHCGSRPRVMNQQALVFIADDDKDMQDLLAISLRRKGFVVSEAGDGARLVELLQEARQSGPVPDLVVTDLQMPRGSGLDVLRWLREWLPDVPAILISAYADASERRQATELGAAAVISKPFALSEVIDRSLLLVRAQLGADHDSRPVERELAHTEADRPTWDVMAPVSRMIDADRVVLSAVVCAGTDGASPCIEDRHQTLGLVAKSDKTKEHIMIGWAVTFFIIAIVAAVLGFSGIAGAATNVAWILFVVGLALAIFFMVRGRKSSV